MAASLIPCQHASNGPTLYKNSLIVSLGKTHNPQFQSPLFSVIPSEIRNAIFVLALTAYDDVSAPHPAGVHYNRPGYRYEHRIDTGLLSTCQRIYTETHDLPIGLNEHVFWFKRNRGPPGVRHSDDPIAYFNNMTTEQREAVKTIHLFTQLCWLEGVFPLISEALSGLPGLRPRNLKITVRHSDWWFWGYLSPPLNLRRGWTQSLSRIHGLETLEVELESVEKDKLQVEGIQKDIRSWRIDAANGNFFSVEDTTQISPHSYEGPSMFDDTLYDHDSGLWGPKHIIPLTNLWKRLTYIVYTTRWTVKKP